MDEPTDGNKTTNAEAKILKEPGAIVPRSSDNNKQLTRYLVDLCRERYEAGTASNSQPSKIRLQVSKPTATETDKGKGKEIGVVELDLGADSCFVLNPTPCMHCAFGLVEGDPRYLCRRDDFANDGRCVECVLAKKWCTWIGVKPSPGGCIDLLSHRKVACILLHKAGRSETTLAALDAMIDFAGKYLVSMWNDANLGELYAMDCQMKSTEGRKKKKKTGKKKQKASCRKANIDKDPETEVSPSGDMSLTNPRTP